MTSRASRLDRLDNLELGMNVRERQLFSQLILGHLAATVTQQDWDDALGHAMEHWNRLSQDNVGIAELAEAFNPERPETQL